LVAVLTSSLFATSAAAATDRVGLPGEVIDGKEGGLGNDLIGGIGVAATVRRLIGGIGVAPALRGWIGVGDVCRRGIVRTAGGDGIDPAATGVAAAAPTF
jgi:hypothetical protein